MWRHQGRFMPLYKNGEHTIKQPVYVSDLAAGIVAACRDADADGKIFQAVGYVQIMTQNALLLQKYNLFYSVTDQNDTNCQNL